MAAAEQPRVKALHELLSHHMVDIYVGSSNTHWILHEKLLCAKSKFFNKLLFNKHAKPGQSQSNKTFGLPDEEDEPFRLFVGWLYSGRVPAPKEEKDLGDLFDLYLMAEKWQIADLIKDSLDTVRTWYRTTDTYPGLRRVQYVYANSDEDSPMRQLLISSIARMIILGDSIPSHWDRALKRNGQLAVDLILAIQHCKLKPEDIPDARQEAQELEKEKVKVAEKAEEQQEGVAKDEQGKDGQGKDDQGKDDQGKDDQGKSEKADSDADADTAAAAGQDVERLADSMSDGMTLTNGSNNDE